MVISSEHIREKDTTMKHKHSPIGHNIEDYTTTENTRKQYAKCSCGSVLTRETTPLNSLYNWTDWSDLQEKG
jgi:hypothetical protein